MKKLIPLIFFVLVLSSLSYAWYSGIAYYNFDKNLNDSGSLGYNYKLYGTSNGYTDNYYSTSNMGSMINFERASNTILTNNSFNNASDIRTIDFWINVTSPCDNNDLFFLLGDNNTYNNRLQFYGGNACHYIHIFLNLNGVSQWAFNYIDTEYTPAQNYSMIHLVLVWNTTDMLLYKNGILHSSNKSATFMNNANFDNLFIGGGYTGGTYFPSASQIDNVFITDGIYSADDVNVSYNIGYGYNFSAPINYTILSPLNRIYSDSLISFNLSTNSFIDTCQYTLNDWTTNITLTKESVNLHYNITTLTSGFKECLFWCNDSINIGTLKGVNFSVSFDIPEINVTTIRAQEVYLYDYNISINFTLSDSNSDLTYFDLYVDEILHQTKLLNATGGWYYNFSKNTSNLSIYTNPHTIRILLNDSVNHQINYTYSFNLLNYSFSLDSYLIETDNQNNSFTINTTSLLGNGNYINITGKFYFLGEQNITKEQKNTEYASGIIYDYVNFSGSFITPYIDYTQNVSSYYELKVYDRDASSNYNFYNITRIQEVVSINLTSCTGISNRVNRTLDIFLLDEIDNTNITGNLQVTFTVAHNSLSRRKNVSMNLTSKSIFNICIYPNWVAYNISSTITYLASNYGYRNYYLNDLSISNHSQNLFLYLINSTSSENIFIYIRDENDDPLRNYRVEALRYYPDEGISKTVQVEQTDYNGLVLMRLIPYTVFYNFIIKNSVGDIIGQTEPRLITQSTFYLRFNLRDDPIQQMEDVNNIAFTLRWDNASGSYTYTYSDASGITRDGCLLVEKLTTYSGKVQQCYNCLSGTSGTIICTLGGNLTGTYTAFALINTTSEHSLITVDILTKNFDNAHLIFGLSGVFLAIILIGTISAFGMWNPAVAIGLCLLSLAISVMIGFVFLSFTSLVGIIILGIFFIIKMRT